MQRTTIDFGIDLGTTNSSIAIIDNTETKIIPNKGGSVTTSSAVWIDKRGQLHVGEEAKKRVSTDPENGDCEFKLRMGMGDEGSKHFVRSDRKMSPEALSAEVLKSLKTDVQASMDETLIAAVITVPAAFELPQTNATQKAAELAGFKRSPLLLEPVAASLAYGFQTSRENEYWLVYDFGGGTFDAAVMRVRDGLIQVVNHNGDNHLGGKLIDWDIVVKRFIPAAVEKFNLPDFQRGNPKWQAAIAALKYHAERAKIEVCRTRSPYEVWIENWCTDADGGEVDFLYTLTPEDVQAVSEPYIQRSLRLCRKTLTDKGLSGENIEQVLMVGGTTLNPWVREAVQVGLNSRVEFGIDPITVVARGAAIFAGTQRITWDASVVDTPAGTYRIAIEHEPVGNVLDPDIGGRVHAPKGTSIEGFTIEFVELKTQWRSGRILLGADGIFMSQLLAEENRRCNYRIELSDPTGSLVPTQPDRVSYTKGVETDSPPIPNSIGVGLANDEMKCYLTKGTKLPAKKTVDHRTTVSLSSGKAEDVVHIPFLEGENPRASRNHGIGELNISGKDICRDLPAGSTIEITLAMDKSHRVRVQVFVPVLDEEFEVDFDFKMSHNSIDELRNQFQGEITRLENVTQKAAANDSLKAQATLENIRSQKLIEEIEGLLAAAKEDVDALNQLDRRLRDLAAAVDEVEDAVEWPTLLEEAKISRDDADNLVGRFGEEMDKKRFRAMETELQRAIDLGDPELLRQAIRQLDSLWFQVANRQPAFHVGRFNRLTDRLDEMRDRNLAEQLEAQGRRAINKDDLDSLKAAISQMISLLPQDAQNQVDKRIGNII
jgi:molecular chaperone DnaK